MAPKRVTDWLLDDAQPAIRYLTLRQLCGKSETDSEVRGARRGIAVKGWGAEILAERNPAGWWARAEDLYAPKYVSTNWRMLVLAELGLGCEHAAVRESCEMWMDRWRLKGGGVGGNSKGTGHHCVVGNMTRALIQMGYADDRRIRRSLEWLVETASPLGGWSCFGSGRNLDSWEGLSALAAYPSARRTTSMNACVERAAEFFLERELHRQGERYEPWYRFHYPRHYYYDVLVGLDLLTSLGYTDDPRLKFGLALLRKKGRSDGRWNLDAIHPDVQGPIAQWYDRHPKQRPIPWGLETPGAPSRMITLIARRVLDRVEGVVSVS